MSYCGVIVKSKLFTSQIEVFIYFNIRFETEHGGKEDMQTCKNLNFHTKLHWCK